VAQLLDEALAAKIAQWSRRRTSQNTGFPKSHAGGYGPHYR
jgi:hypothetical protein